jgi:photosystem II stability/assembly factor-like uncharacterized protein
MDRDPGADLVKPCARFGLLLLLLTSCAAPAAVPAEQQSTAGHIVTTATGSRGSVFFVSDQVGWVFTIPPDDLRTVVFRTGDGGRHWRLWGIAPTRASGLLGLGANEVVLQGQGCPAQCDQSGMVRSGDGAHWSFATTPTGDMPFFLPDLQHGWVFGFEPQPPCDSCLPQGKGGPPGPPAPPTPSGVWYTADGGVSWRMQMHGNFGDLGGQLTFWNTDDGVLVQPPAGGSGAEVMWSTHDGGVTWNRLTFSLPSQALVTASQLTMFDQSHGLLALRGAATLYISETSDAGKTWSTPRDMTSCLECSGQVFYLDSRRWLAYDKRFYMTSDAGATWHPTSPAITAKNMSAVEVMRLTPGTVIALEPGVIASMTTDWGAHWRAVGLPQIYQSYRGFNGSGGVPFCCI